LGSQFEPYPVLHHRDGQESENVDATNEWRQPFFPTTWVKEQDQAISLKIKLKRPIFPFLKKIIFENLFFLVLAEK